MRAPASLGVFDVIAVQAGRIRLIEVKSTVRIWGGFPPADRAALLEAADRAGGEAELCWWPKNGKPKFLTPAEWP
jgi:Holliday junction resolvase